MGNYRAGKGRIAVYYNSLEGSVTSDPAAYTDDTLILGYVISGILSESAIVRVYDRDTYGLAASYSGTIGAYQVDVPASAYYDVIAKSEVNGAILGYGDVLSHELA